MTGPASLRGRTAGSVTRLTAFIADIIIISILIRAAGWFLEDVRLATGIQINLPEMTEAVGSTTPMQLTALAGLLIGLTYMLFFWTMGGQTPGKAVMGVRVVRLDGQPMRLGTAVLRLIGYGVVLATLGFGFLPILIDNRRQEPADKLAGTCVVYSWNG